MRQILKFTAAQLTFTIEGVCFIWAYLCHTLIPIYIIALYFDSAEFSDTVASFKVGTLYDVLTASLYVF